MIGFPITMVPFLPFQSLIACFVALCFRANLLLCVGLQFLSTPLTAPIQLPACYWAGEVVKGRSPVEVWRELRQHPRDLLSGDALTSLYLGAFVLGTAGGALGYIVIQRTWKMRPRPARPAGKLEALPEKREG